MRIESGSEFRLCHFFPSLLQLSRFPANLGVCIHETSSALQIQGQYESGDNGARTFFDNTGIAEAPVTGDVDQHSSEILSLRELE